MDNVGVVTTGCPSNNTEQKTMRGVISQIPQIVRVNLFSDTGVIRRGHPCGDGKQTSSPSRNNNSTNQS